MAVLPVLVTVTLPVKPDPQSLAMVSPAVPVPGAARARLTPLSDAADGRASGWPATVMEKLLDPPGLIGAACAVARTVYVLPLRLTISAPEMAVMSAAKSNVRVQFCRESPPVLLTVTWPVNPAVVSAVSWNVTFRLWDWTMFVVPFDTILVALGLLRRET